MGHELIPTNHTYDTTFLVPLAGEERVRAIPLGGPGSVVKVAEALVPGTMPKHFDKEALAGGAIYGDGGVIPYEETEFDRAVAALGLIRVVNLMLADPKIGGAIDTIKTGILADGIDVTPSHLPKFGSDAEDEFHDEDAKNAFETGQFVARCLDRLIHPVPIESTLWQLLDGFLYGCKLGEMVFVVDEEGIDQDMIVLDRIKIKNSLNWSFVLDRFGNVVGISGGYIHEESEESGLRVLPRAKFVIFHWNPADDDPRGRPLARRVYKPWFDKIQTVARYNVYLDKFAAPSWVGTVGPDEQTMPDRDPVTGKVLNENTSPVTQMMNALVAMKDCSALALAYGATAEPKYPTSSGEAFLTALAYQDKQIVSAILLASRATEEAQHGSRADSESAQDTMGTVIRHGKTSLGRCLRQDVARMLVCLNYGEDWAARYTPLISLGKTEHMDFSRNAGAVSKLTAAGFLDESQRPGLCTFLGLPLPKPTKDGKIRYIGQPDPAAPAEPGTPAEKKPAPKTAAAFMEAVQVAYFAAMKEAHHEAAKRRMAEGDEPDSE